MICTFFGHRDTPDSIAPLIKELLVFLIEKRGISEFLVGNHGNFDSMVYRQLAVLADIYPISYNVVYAYMPTKRNSIPDCASHSILPDNTEKTPARFAICHRNKWMLRQADIVVVYVAYPSSGAARFKEEALTQHKEVINIYDIETKPL